MQYGDMTMAELKRWKVMTAYPPGDWWADVDAMTDAQISNIYLRMIYANQIQ